MHFWLTTRPCSGFYLLCPCRDAPSLYYPASRCSGSLPQKILILDVSRAHFYARASRDVYIQLPKEDARSGERDVCGKLLRTMYGTLDALEKWGEHYSQILLSHGFVRGRASPCHFTHPTWGVHLLVHGDDFVIVARREGRARTLKLLEDNFEIKHTCAGLCQGQA